MIRLFVVALATFGAGLLFQRCFPEKAAVEAFKLGGFSFTYLIIGCVVAGILAYKVTK